MHASEPALAAAPLWARARASFARAIMALGEPAAFAAIAVLTRAMRRTIVRWLHPLENVVRKLLFVEAAQLHRAALAQARRGPRVEIIQLRASGLYAPTSAAPDAPRSSRARASTRHATFSLALPHDPCAVPAARGPRILATWGDSRIQEPVQAPATHDRHQEPSPARLARRFEALRRALDDPLPLARRLARLLVRLGRRFPEIVRRFVHQPARSDGYDSDDPRLGVEVVCAGLDAQWVFLNSS